MEADRLAGLLSPWTAVRPKAGAIATGVRALVLDGRLPAGTRLPAERRLAVLLGVSRTTVTGAYDVLRREGYLHSDHGAGSRVAVPSPPPAHPEAVRAREPAVWDLTVAALPAPPQLLDCLDAAAQALRPLLGGHGLHPLGLPSLREAIAGHLDGRGLLTSPDQILVTNGALHGWSLVLAGNTRPGDRVVVEQPTYPAIIDGARTARTRPVPMAVTAAGWDPPATPGVVAHVTPDGHNPTGVSASVHQRRELLAALGAATVVCDETFADLRLDGAAPPPLAALDDSVITIGSMSKAFWAGLRVGWVRASPAVVARLAVLRSGGDLAGPVLDQLLAAALLARSEEVLAGRRDQLGRNRDALGAALQRSLPDWRWTPPTAGMALWIELPADLSATRLAVTASDLGVRVTPGPRFTVDGTADRWVRLPLTVPPQQVEEVVDLLVAAAEAARAARPSHRRRRTPWEWTA